MAEMTHDARATGGRRSSWPLLIGCAVSTPVVVREIATHGALLDHHWFWGVFFLCTVSDAVLDLRDLWRRRRGG